MRVAYHTRFDPWERITPVLKAPFLTKAIAEKFPAYALTLRLGPDRIAEGEASPKGLLRHVHEQARRNLERALGRSFASSLWLGLEFGAKGVPHLHGVIGLNPNEVEVAQRVLCRLCGAYRGPRKVEMPLIGYDMGWVDYVTMEASFTAKVSGHSPIAAPRELVQRARDLYWLAITQHRLRVVIYARSRRDRLWPGFATSRRPGRAVMMNGLSGLPNATERAGRCSAGSCGRSRRPAGCGSGRSLPTSTEIEAPAA